MRIVHGLLRNRFVTVPKTIRVVGARVRKSLFDILRDEINDKTILDLFAGCGSLGIEALSLGAKKATFVDINKSSVKAIKHNLALLGLSYKSEVIMKDVNKAIRDFYFSKKEFDIIFLDPPYYQGLIRNTLQTLKDYVIVAHSGYIVCLGYYRDIINDNGIFRTIFKKKYGQTELIIYKYNQQC